MKKLHEKAHSLLINSRLLKHFHAYMTIMWGVLIPVTILTDLKTSITWIALMSVWANFVGHFSSWQSTRTEVKIDDSENINTDH